jgi:hypothetical protein
MLAPLIYQMTDLMRGNHQLSMEEEVYFIRGRVDLMNGDLVRHPYAFDGFVIHLLI